MWIAGLEFSCMVIPTGLTCADVRLSTAGLRLLLFTPVGVCVHVQILLVWSAWVTHRNEVGSKHGGGWIV